MASSYPLTLITGAKLRPYFHSQYRNIPSIRKLAPEPLLEINTGTAVKLGIQNGDMVSVETVRGSIKLRAKVTDDIHTQVVSMQHGWSEANANILIDDQARDPVSAYPGFISILCRVQKLGNEG